MPSIRAKMIPGKALRAALPCSAIVEEDGDDGPSLQLLPDETDLKRPDVFISPSVAFVLPSGSSDVLESSTGHRLPESADRVR